MQRRGHRLVVSCRVIVLRQPIQRRQPQLVPKLLIAVQRYDPGREPRGVCRIHREQFLPIVPPELLAEQGCGDHRQAERRGLMHLLGSARREAGRGDEQPVAGVKRFQIGDRAAQGDARMSFETVQRHAGTGEARDGQAGFPAQ